MQSLRSYFAARTHRRMKHRLTSMFHELLSILEEERVQEICQARSTGNVETNRIGRSYRSGGQYPKKKEIYVTPVSQMRIAINGRNYHTSRIIVSHLSCVSGLENLSSYQRRIIKISHQIVKSSV